MKAFRSVPLSSLERERRRIASLDKAVLLIAAERAILAGLFPRAVRQLKIAEDALAEALDQIRGEE